MIKEFELPEDPKRHEREGAAKDPCVICGRNVNVKRNPNYVHMSTKWVAVNTEDESAVDSQGFFPIGPECKKKVPKEFIFSLPPIEEE